VVSEQSSNEAMRQNIAAKGARGGLQHKLPALLERGNRA
jgi:hypothetical protein